MTARVTVTACNAETFLKATFRGQSSRWAGLDVKAFAKDLEQALAEFQINKIVIDAGLDTKETRALLSRISSSFKALNDGFSIIEQAGLMSTLAGKLSDPDVDGIPQDDRGLVAWLIETRQYQSGLETLLSDIEKIPKKKGRRFSSSDRFLIGYALAGVYEKHLGKKRSMDGPWGRFVAAMCVFLKISITDSSADASTRRTKKRNGSEISN